MNCAVGHASSLPLTVRALTFVSFKRAAGVDRVPQMSHMHLPCVQRLRAGSSRRVVMHALLHQDTYGEREEGGMASFEVVKSALGIAGVR